MKRDTFLPNATLDEKVDYYFSTFKKSGKSYTRNDIKRAIEHLSYKIVDPMPKTESATNPSMYIFRHGQTEDNADFTFSGWRDSPLTQKGRDQALNLSEKLQDKNINMLISSPQIRAVETLKLALSKNKQAQKLEIVTDPRIQERSYGDLQGKSKLEFYLDNPKELENIRRSFTYKVTNGESIAEVCSRVADFLDEIVPMIKQTGINVAISCHGNSIRGFRRYFEHLSDIETATLETPLAQDYLAYEIR